MTPRVREILSWYGSENPGVLTNMARMMNTGTLAGTGKFVILPVDQGFEHGPARSFAINPDGYDPSYHVSLAIEAGCNAYAAPLGFIEAISRDFAGEIPLILKINNSDFLYKPKSGPISALTSGIDAALRLGCTAIGFTIYPGSSERKEQYEEFQKAAEEAKKAGLVVVLWAYPRGESLTKDGETAVDVVSYAAQISAQMGAHIIKVKPPTSHIEIPEAAKVYKTQGIRTERLSDRVKHVVESAFNGKRVVIFSGGETKTTEDIMAEVKEIALGGGFGSIMGRNAFQRPRKEAITLLKNVMAAFRGEL
jgi:class I fructose-bisphosphate aldolase